MEIKNKVAIITGASKGIGKVTAIALAERGCHIAISARGKNLLNEVADDAKAFGVEALAFAADISGENNIRRFVAETMEKFGRIDLLINNAGLGIFKPIAEMPTEDWDSMFNLNMRGLFIMTRECLPHLRRAGESVIVNVASLAGKNAFVNGGGYTATKHALLGFSRCLMLEERKNGVRVLAICPGSVDTEFSAGRLAENDPKRDRIIKPEDVSSAIIHMIELPQRSMISEIDIRPSNP